MDLDDLLTGGFEDDDVDAILQVIRDRYGLANVAYAGANPIAGKVYGKSTYDVEWLSHYMSHGYHTIDPTINEARRSIAPVDWTRLERTDNFRKVFRDAHDFGISDVGLTLPVRGPLGDVGGLSVTTDMKATEWAKWKPQLMRDLQAYTVHIHDRVMRQDRLTAKLSHPNMSSREVEILQWIAAGKSQQDIGDILTISHRTVEVHLRSARTKLNALTTAQAVGRAISMGLIHSD